MEKDKKNLNSYEDIMELPHHVSVTHPHMEILDRAAQFLPFAALTGHEAAIKETARLTNQRVELDETRQEVLNEKLILIMERIEKQPAVAVTFFVPDEKKDGGSYITVEGVVKKFDGYGNRLMMQDGVIILLNDIIEIDALDCCFSPDN